MWADRCAFGWSQQTDMLFYFFSNLQHAASCRVTKLILARPKRTCAIIMLFHQHLYMAGCGDNPVNIVDIVCCFMLRFSFAHQLKWIWDVTWPGFGEKKWMNYFESSYECLNRSKQCEWTQQSQSRFPPLEWVSMTICSVSVTAVTEGWWHSIMQIWFEIKPLNWVHVNSPSAVHRGSNSIKCKDTDASWNQKI